MSDAVRASLEEMVEWANSPSCPDCTPSEELYMEWFHEAHCGHLEAINRARALLGLDLAKTYKRYKT